MRPVTPTSVWAKFSGKISAGGLAMWVRFTERARRVVFFAQEEAGRLGENYVSTEHLLLGIVREHDTVAARILETLGVTLEAIRIEIERQARQGEGRTSAEMQLTPKAKVVIDYAYEEARLLKANISAQSPKSDAPARSGKWQARPGNLGTLQPEDGSAFAVALTARRGALGTILHDLERPRSVRLARTYRRGRCDLASGGDAREISQARFRKLFALVRGVGRREKRGGALRSVGKLSAHRRGHGSVAAERINGF